MAVLIYIDGVLSNDKGVAITQGLGLTRTLQQTLAVILLAKDKEKADHWLKQNSMGKIDNLVGVVPNGDNDPFRQAEWCRSQGPIDYVITADPALSAKLLEDAKENAEHVMLVDLARNDLSRSCTAVTVSQFKQVKFYSHVIHLVSEVVGTLGVDANPFNLLAQTFPAGTLSGAPKYMAMQLIDRFEGQKRGFYSGAIGFMGFNGDFNHAIMIRSFLSQNNILHYQAGAGIVSDSDPQSELNEVNNKRYELPRVPALNLLGYLHYLHIFQPVRPTVGQ